MHNSPTCLDDFWWLWSSLLFSTSIHFGVSKSQWPQAKPVTSRSNHIICCPALKCVKHEYTSLVESEWIRDPMIMVHLFGHWTKDKYHQDSHLSPLPNPSSWYLLPRTGRSGSRFPGVYNLAITWPSLGQQGSILLRVMNMRITWIWNKHE